MKEVREEPFAVNILFTHHHPYKNEEIYDEDYSEMVLGGKLVAALSDATSSNWLIIHGHQHYPLLKYGAGEAFPPVIFSAGSVSAKITSPLSAEAPNQFYHLTIETDKARTAGWDPCGTIRAWSWLHRREWQPTPEGQNIPDGAGFGCRDNVQSIANIICAHITPLSSPITINQLYAAYPQLQFVVRKVFDQVIKALKQLNIRCTITKPFGLSELRKE